MHMDQRKKPRGSSKTHCRSKFCIPITSDPRLSAQIRGSKSLMTEDFYCEEVLSGRTEVARVRETANVLAYYHTRPYWPTHIVVIPKQHISSLLTLEPVDNPLLLELIDVVREVAAEVVAKEGACRVLTNLGKYQDSKHLHWHVSAGEPLR